MVQEIAEKVTGVAAFIVSSSSPELFLTIEELQTKSSTHKIAGMRSIPMETTENVETFEDTLRRLLKEEVVVESIVTDPLDQVKLCQVQLRDGVWLHTFLLQTTADNPVTIGSTGLEVADPQWIDVNEVLNENIGSRRFRPGVKEIVQSYCDFISGNLVEPEIYFSTQDQIPDSVFDAMETNRIVAESQDDLVQIP